MAWFGLVGGGGEYDSTVVVEIESGMYFKTRNGGVIAYGSGGQEGGGLSTFPYR